MLLYVYILTPASQENIDVRNKLQNTKQLKCIPFPHYTPDDDVAMSDASSETSPIDEAYHTRLSSNASSSSCVSDGPIGKSYPSAQSQCA